MLNQIKQPDRKLTYIETLYPVLLAVLAYRMTADMISDSIIVAALGAAVGALAGSLLYRTVENRSTAVKILVLIVAFFGSLFLVLLL